MDRMSSDPADPGLVRPRLVWRILFPVMAAGCLIAGFAGNGLIWLAFSAGFVLAAFMAHAYVIIIDRGQQVITTRRGPLRAEHLHLNQLSEITFGRDTGLEYFPMRIACRDQHRNYFHVETWFWTEWRSVAAVLREAVTMAPDAPDCSGDA